jgi:gamma-glutamylaminecyclotransferase
MSPSTSGAHKVFVYGTLKRGLYNHRLLERGNARFMGEVRTKRAQHVMLLADAGYPYLVKSTTDDARVIDGELYSVDDDTLTLLDELEEVSSGMYTRETIEVERLDGARATEEAYYYLAGDREDLARLPRIEAYDKALHDDVYLPKDQRGR